MACGGCDSGRLEETMPESPMSEIGSTPPARDVLLLSADCAIIHSGVAVTTIWVMVEDDTIVAAARQRKCCVNNRLMNVRCF